VITGSTESQGYKEPEIKEPTKEVEQKKKKITTLGVVLINCINGDGWLFVS
jgi:hypothetical protein